jgi:hypothetical protein
MPLQKCSPKIGRAGTSAPDRGAAWRQRPGPSPISPLRQGFPCSSTHEEPRNECARILPPAVSTAPLSSAPTAEHFERLPQLCTPQQRGDGHSRSWCSRLRRSYHHRSPAKPHAPARSACGNRCVAGQLIAAQAVPGRPGLTAPKRKARSQKPDAVLVTCGSIRLITACNSYSGRKPSAPIVLSGSWPCHPSTRPTSRSSQPACRRISVAGPRPSTRRTPRRVCGHGRRLRKLAAAHACSLTVPY